MTNSTINQTLAQEFSATHTEHLLVLDDLLLTLQQDPENTELLTSFFNHLRNIEGGAGFHDYAQLEQICHCGTELLSRLQKTEIRFNQTINTYLSKLLSDIKQLLTTIKNEHNDTQCNLTELNTLLTNIEFNAEPDEKAKLEEKNTPEKNSDIFVKTAAVSDHSNITITLERIGSLAQTQSLYEKLKHVCC